MRKLNIGSSLPKKSWTPKHKITVERPNDTVKSGQKNSMIVDYFPTWKCGKVMMPLRKYFHYKFAELLEADSSVTRWTSQTEPLPYTHGGRERIFTPNFLVTDANGTRVVRLLSDEDAKEFAHHPDLRKSYRERGLGFEAFPDAMIESDPRLSAAKFLLRHRYWDCPEDLHVRAAALAAGQPIKTLGSLHAHLGGHDETWPQVLSLVAQGHVAIKLASTLDADTAVIACTLKGYL